MKIVKSPLVGGWGRARGRGSWGRGGWGPLSVIVSSVARHLDTLVVTSATFHRHRRKVMAAGVLGRTVKLVLLAACLALLLTNSWRLQTSRDDDGEGAQDGQLAGQD